MNYYYDSIRNFKFNGYDERYDYDDSSQNFKNMRLEELTYQMKEILCFKEAREAMELSYTGIEEYFLEELSNYISILQNHRSGLLFLYKILKKAKLIPPTIIHDIFNISKDLINNPVGCRIIKFLIPFSDDEMKQAIAQDCLKVKSKNYSDDFAALFTYFIQNQNYNVDHLQKFFDFDYYTKHPNALLIGRAIIEFHTIESVSKMFYIFISRLNKAIFSETHMSLVISLIYRVPVKNAVEIFQKLDIKSMIFHDFQWKIVHALISVLPLREKAIIADIIAVSILEHIKYDIPSRVDQLCKYSFQMIDRISRHNILTYRPLTDYDLKLPIFCSFMENLILKVG